MQAERNYFILASLENQGSQLRKVKKKYKSITWKISTWLDKSSKKVRIMQRQTSFGNGTRELCGWIMEWVLMTTFWYKTKDALMRVFFSFNPNNYNKIFKKTNSHIFVWICVGCWKEINSCRKKVFLKGLLRHRDKSSSPLKFPGPNIQQLLTPSPGRPLL